MADFDMNGIPPKIRDLFEERTGAAVKDAAGATPTKEEFNALLKSLRDAGLIKKRRDEA